MKLVHLTSTSNRKITWTVTNNLPSSTNIISVKSLKKKSEGLKVTVGNCCNGWDHPQEASIVLTPETIADLRDLLNDFLDE